MKTRIFRFLVIMYVQEKVGYLFSFIGDLWWRSCWQYCLIDGSLNFRVYYTSDSSTLPSPALNSSRRICAKLRRSFFPLDFILPFYFVLYFSFSFFIQNMDMHGRINNNFSRQLQSLFTYRVCRRTDLSYRLTKLPCETEHPFCRCSPPPPWLDSDSHHHITILLTHPYVQPCVQQADTTLRATEFFPGNFCYITLFMLLCHKAVCL